MNILLVEWKKGEFLFFFHRYPLPLIYKRRIENIFPCEFYFLVAVYLIVSLRRCGSCHILFYILLSVSILSQNSLFCYNDMKRRNKRTII